MTTDIAQPINHGPQTGWFIQLSTDHVNLQVLEVRVTPEHSGFHDGDPFHANRARELVAGPITFGTLAFTAPIGTSAGDRLNKYNLDPRFIRFVDDLIAATALANARRASR